MDEPMRFEGVNHVALVARDDGFEVFTHPDRIAG